MSSSKEYKTGGDTEHNYQVRGVTNSGIKILRTQNEPSPERMPSYSNTPNTMYAKTEGQTKVIKQVAVYGTPHDSRQILKQIDIGHEHTNRDTDGRYFGKNDIHVHDFYIDKKGHIRRSNKVRPPSAKERRTLMMAKYGGAKWNV